MAGHKFKRSEYDSVLKEDSPYRDYKDKSTPLFLDAELGHLVMWSGKGDIPDIGDTVTMRTPVSYTGTVQSHFIEAGFIGLCTTPNPEYHEILSQQGYGNLPKVGEEWIFTDVVWNYGCDLATDKEQS
tara:strand:+ start:606 stop:989 length:384 start_codon:yes stop_codon:yes gene_type:complete